MRLSLRFARGRAEAVWGLSLGATALALAFCFWPLVDAVLRLIGR
jgi:hypothetical protein